LATNERRRQTAEDRPSSPEAGSARVAHGSARDQTGLCRLAGNDAVQYKHEWDGWHQTNLGLVFALHGRKTSSP
jgi:hypothetical protein